MLLSLKGNVPPAILALADGTVFIGNSIGATGTTVGEVVFNTAITGYQEILTDPSYCRQIVTLTYPHIGNYGVNTEDIEADKVHAAGLIIKDLPLLASNFRASGTLSQYLVRENTVAIGNIDTRKLTRLLRTKGAQNGAIVGLAAGEAVTQAVIDRAIAAADRTKNEHNYALRYLSPYSDQVRPAATNQSLDSAWVYGLMRQESRFITNAKSSAGASGLMQLMPATAKWVARKIGLKDFRQGQVNDTETNLLLGTTYMRLVMESLDNHPVLASAAYNAGPGRARKWRADHQLEGAIYAETIPFNETRDYVKKVMSNSVYYSALFEGRPQTIKSRLGVIGPRATVDPKAEVLP
mgnify:CR=1 FL=1